MILLQDQAVVSAGRRSARRRGTAAVVIAILVVALGGVGIAVYFERVAPFQKTVLVVDDTSVPMDYFLKRVAMSAGDPLAVLQAIAYEDIIRRAAPEAPYRLSVSDAEVDAALRTSARGTGPELAPAEFGEWYRQQLNDTRLTDAEFRSLTRTRLLSGKMADYLAKRIPTVAAQVHLYAIGAESVDALRKLRARVGAGEDFRELARSENNDPALKASGGDLGWFARSGLPEGVGRVAFEVLPVGGVSDPLFLAGDKPAILMVAERADARQIDEDALRISRSKALGDWAASQLQEHRVEFRGFSGGYDSDTDAWVRAEVAKLRVAVH
jgi:hypothetical protein